MGAVLRSGRQTALKCPPQTDSPWKARGLRNLVPVRFSLLSGFPSEPRLAPHCTPADPRLELEATALTGQAMKRVNPHDTVYPDLATPVCLRRWAGLSERATDPLPCSA